MDAHVFRRIAAELAPRITGARVHKIYSLSEQSLLFVLESKTQETHKLYLIFNHGRDNPAIFFVPEKPTAPEHPNAPTMRLRKYIQGKHIRRVFNYWTERSLALDFSDQNGASSLLLILNLSPPPERPAALLHTGPPPGAEADLAWPAPSELPALLADENAWRKFPALTPLLRKTLPLLDAPEQAALLMDLKTEEGDIFVYEDPSPAPHTTQAHTMLSAWPLPQILRRGRAEHIFPARPGRALTAAQYCFAKAGMDSVNLTVRANLHAEEARAHKREKRLAANLDEEERKLREWCAGKENALLLQANLHCFPKDFKGDSLILDGPNGAARIALDPKLNIGDNMRRLFRLAAKGARGLEHLATRRAELAASTAASPHLFTPDQAQLSANSAFKGSPAALPNKTTGKNRVISPLYKDISRFISSEGFIILRGRNAAGNRDLLKIASGHDYWFHAKEGPSAHAILRRAHALEEVPDKSLFEAATLTALKSAWKNDLRAEVMMALVRDVHPVKGGPPGSVHVDKLMRVLVAPLEQDLETRLKKGGYVDDKSDFFL